MRNRSKESRGRRFWRVALAGLVLAGVIGRFSFLDRKILWVDEAVTLIRVACTSIAALEQKRESRSGELRNLGDVKNSLSVGADGGATRVVSSLLSEEPQHTPFFYVLERGFVEYFGVSLFSLRFLSALFGVFALWAMHWFAMEWEGDADLALLLTALLALSPLMLNYSQIARGYSLWIFLILASGAALLRALRLNDRKAWALYGALSVISLYTHIFSLLLLGAHGAFVLSVHRKQRIAVRRFFLQMAISVVVIAPWLWILFSRFDLVEQTTSWVRIPISATEYLTKSLLNFVRIYFDRNATQFSTLFRYAGTGIVTVLLLAFQGWTLLSFFRNETRAKKKFVLFTVVFFIGVFLLYDGFLNRRIGIMPRFLMPVWVVCFLIQGSALHRCQLSKNRSKRHFGFGALVFLFALSLYSDVRYLRANSSWTHVPQELAFSTLDMVKDPGAVVEVGNFESRLSSLGLAYRLPGSTPFFVIRGPEDLKLLAGLSTFYSIKAPLWFQEKLKGRYDIQVVVPRRFLYRFKSR